eukprot:TRINITY_DN29656_c0_g1_i1.p1 TRINITY_DN29656_c0_g1~~TRINITY_DN29656_c0_g1_i1.p1  ORF type:complete len:452 (+),score=76.21 TRINITY_DN29656_c0_g1_i1:37-1392(+)
MADGSLAHDPFPPLGCAVLPHPVQGAPCILTGTHGVGSAGEEWAEMSDDDDDVGGPFEGGAATLSIDSDAPGASGGFADAADAVDRQRLYCGPGSRAVLLRPKTRSLRAFRRDHVDKRLVAAPAPLHTAADAAAVLEEYAAELDRMVSEYRVDPEVAEVSSKVGTFDVGSDAASDVRREFMTIHGAALKQKLDEIGYTVSPAAVHGRIVEAFRQRAVREGLAPSVAWHGTAEGNVSSILDMGLKLPNSSSHPIGIAHGNAFGPGIYAGAGVENVSVSQGYVRGDEGLLLCGVVDVNKPSPDERRHEKEPQPAAQPAAQTRYRHNTRQHRTTRRVKSKKNVVPLASQRWGETGGKELRSVWGGTAYVAFKEDLLCPLYLAKPCDSSAKHSTKGESAAVQPALFRDPATATTIFRPPTHEGTTKAEMKLRRRCHHRQIDLERRQRRADKHVQP